MRCQQQNWVLHALLIALVGVMMMGNTNHTFFSMGTSKPTKNVLKVLGVIAAAVALSMGGPKVLETVKPMIDRKKEDAREWGRRKVQTAVGAAVDQAKPFVRDLIDQGKNTLYTEADNMYGPTAIKRELGNLYNPLKTGYNLYTISAPYRAGYSVGAYGLAAAGGMASTAGGMYDTYQEWMKTDPETDSDKQKASSKRNAAAGKYDASWAKILGKPDEGITDLPFDGKLPYNTTTQSPAYYDPPTGPYMNAMTNNLLRN